MGDRAQSIAAIVARALVLGVVAAALFYPNTQTIFRRLQQKPVQGVWPPRHNLQLRS